MTVAPAAHSPEAGRAVAPRCSVSARERRDPLVGSAVPAPRWLLIEHPGPWAASVLETPPLTEVAGPLQALLDRHHARPQLIRRHGRFDRDRGSWAYALVDSRSGGVVWGEWRAPHDLVAAAEGLGDVPAQPCDDPILLVCTHGRKDVCCAMAGRPIAALLEDAWATSVWETSHLGGDRFAGNLAILPEGSMYGYLDGSAAVDVVRDHVDGTVTVAHWRGRTVWHPAVQTAVAAVLRLHPGTGLADVRPQRLEELGRHDWRVTVSGPAGSEQYEVHRTMRPPRSLTCGAAEPKPAAEYHVRAS